MKMILLAKYAICVIFAQLQKGNRILNFY